MDGLALKAFLQDKEDQYTLEFTQLKHLRTLTDQRDNSASKKLVEVLSQSKLLSDYSNFIKEKVLSNVLSHSKLLSEYSNFIKEKVLSNGISSAIAISCQITATSSRRRY